MLLSFELIYHGIIEHLNWPDFLNVKTGDLTDLNSK